ncbi:MAG: hypothetical protein NTX25_18055 [Proteobacteria bacterium]|nr:hypothetical protein [Pseudomonadota bacterium]
MQKCLLIIIFIVFLPALAFGQEPKQKFEGLLNQLLAPGPLILGHEKLEHTDCLKSHEAAGGVPNKLCLDCHKEIRRDVIRPASIVTRIIRDVILIRFLFKPRPLTTVKLDLVWMAPMKKLIV